MMSMTGTEHRYPVGIQTFEKIIEGGYVYVDKTDLIWKLTRLSNYVFLSRPRRFGKSLLSSTLRSYFEGRKDLFEGLKIMSLEQEWTEYPVIHIDLSVCKSQENAQALQQRIMLMLKEYANKYGREEEETTPGSLLQGIGDVPASRLAVRLWSSSTSMTPPCLRCSTKMDCCQSSAE